MKKLFALLALVFATGCYNHSTPINIIGYMTEAVENGDLEKLNRALTKDAKKIYGNAKSLESLKKKLAALNKPDLEKEVLVSKSKKNNPTWTDWTYFYNVKVKNQGKAVGSIDVVCEYTEDHEPCRGFDGPYFDPIAESHCVGSQTQFCLVNKINL